MLLKQLLKEGIGSGTRNYVLVGIDPATGEFTEYGRGSIRQIMVTLERDPENSMLADVLKQQTAATFTATNGIHSFKHEGDFFAFLPL